jgi:hypothetical protein
MFRIAIGVGLIPGRDLLIKGAANGVLIGLRLRNSGRPANNTMAIAIAYIEPPLPMKLDGPRSTDRLTNAV